MRVNEIFYSLQGEGHYTGTPAVFVRFSGCNLKCNFCDTDFSKYTEIAEEEIVKEVCKYPSRIVVITGGEPTLQLNNKLISLLHKEERYVCLETNGTQKLENGLSDMIDWITCSPKDKPVILERIDELKVVYQNQDMSQYNNLKAQEYYLQPCDVKNNEKNAENTRQTVEFIKKHPKWKLSLQAQKILNVR